MNIDKKLFRVIELLTENSRITTKKIAKEIKTSQQNASYLLNKLKKDKILISNVLLVDSSKLNLTNFLVLIRLKSNSLDSINKFISILEKYNNITVIETIFGNYDILLKFTTLNNSYFNKILKEILVLTHDNIISYEILTEIVEYHLSKNYLFEKKDFKGKILAGDRNSEVLDSIDLNILNLLNKDSRTNFSKIASNLDLSSKTIISRVKSMEKLKIIRGYSIALNYSLLNLSKKYLFIKTNLEKIELESNFITYLKKSSNVTEIIKTFGNWDIILAIEANNENDFKNLLFQIKEKFPKYILNYDFLESVEIKRFKCIPQIDIN